MVNPSESRPSRCSTGVVHREKSPSTSSLVPQRIGISKRPTFSRWVQSRRAPRPDILPCTVSTRANGRVIRLRLLLVAMVPSGRDEEVPAVARRYRQYRHWPRTEKITPLSRKQSTQESGGHRRKTCGSREPAAIPMSFSVLSETAF